MIEKKPRPRQDIVARFDGALAHASKLRGLLASLPRQSFAYRELLDGALAPYRAVLDEYATLAAAAIPKAGQGEAGLAAADAAYERVTVALSDILERAANAPPLLREQTILLDEGEVFRQEQPGTGNTPQPAGVPGCCITYVELENVYDGELHVVVTNAQGTRRERDFTKKKPVRKVWKKPEVNTDDDEGKKATDGVIDGGLGKCITLLIQIISTDARGVKTYTPDPPYSIEICCDNRDMVDGAVLNRPEPTPTPGAPPQTVSRLPLLKIKKIVALTPCPDEVAGTGKSDHAIVGSGVKPMDGVKRIDGKIFYGAWGRFAYTDNRCKNPRFVQGKKRTVLVKYPGKDKFEPFPPMTKDDKWYLDTPVGSRTPEYPSSELANGGREMNDGPGVTNPWDGGPEVDGKKKPFPPGTELTITWVFRTWVVCLDTQPVTVLGHFDWQVVLHLTVGADQAHTSGKADVKKPTWTDDPDKDNYEKVAGQATDAKAFVPAQ
ncbi:MAG: hypothetical protein EPO64_13780 [Nitrospirae bacterium]|nr:MAG: hypothetical protein EPO64_13780 [Nitrospirota bacterium]